MRVIPLLIVPLLLALQAAAKPRPSRFVADDEPLPELAPSPVAMPKS